MKRSFLPRLLLTSDPSDGGAKPPAAEIVLNSDVKESDAAEIVRLKREREKDGEIIKAREIRIAELEDENRALKVIPAPKVEAANAKKGFLDGATFFG